MFRVIFVILWFIWCDQIKANDFFLATSNGKNRRYICVTNSSFAMSWNIEEIGSMIPNDPAYIPPENTFDNDIRLLQNHNWVFVNSSLNSRINDIILDERWQILKSYMTDFAYEKDQNLPFQTVIETLQHDFEIPLSIRIQKEGHIFLCDGNYPPNSNCYWLMLQAWNDTKSAIRKCSLEHVPALNEMYPKNSCGTLLTEVHHSGSHPHPLYLSNKIWTHFKIAKQGKSLNFTQVLKNENKVILKIVDEDELINVTHMIVHSKINKGLWKIHNLDFMYTEEENNYIELDKATNLSQNYLCISLYVAMCNSCKIKLTLFDKSKQKIVDEEEFENTKLGWSEIKFTTEKVTNSSKVNFSISTIGQNTDRFWAVDNIRLCQKNEFRTISLTEEATCQLMSEENKTISTSEDSKKSTSSCAEDAIGDFCVPCGWMFEKCEEIKICGENECVCAAGYEGKKCKKKCDQSYYGHGCQKKCSNCKNPKCNHISGICPKGGCINGFVTEKCNKHPLVFLATPKIVPNYFTADVKVDNFTIEKDVVEQPLAYIIQYKEANEKNLWNNVGLQKKFHETAKITIVGLKPDKEYFIRAVIISVTDKTYDGRFAKFDRFKTKCDDISEDNIDREISNTSASFFIKDSTKLCNFDGYNIQITSLLGNNRSTRKATFANNSIILFKDLNPFSLYRVAFTKDITVTFGTKEGVPEAVDNLTIVNTSSTQVTVKWSKPQLWGSLKHYTVQYSLHSYLACDREVDSKVMEIKTFKDNIAAIDNLIPYARYIFYVSASNTALAGKSDIIYATTSPSKEITSDEQPTIEKIQNGNTTVDLNLTLSCEKIRGPISAKTTIECFDEWCNNTKDHRMISITKSRKIHLDDLLPFSSYTIILKICRNEGTCNKKLREETFKTNPAPPGEVRDLLVYSKNGNSVSLRWKPPYPPNGVLKSYQVNCKFEESQKENVNKETEPCKLWSDFYCATISNLDREKEYKFEVYARNEQPSDFGKINSIKATTKKEPSEAPYDLDKMWTDQNDLELIWKHPNKTNGEIESFGVDLGYGNKILEKLQVNITSYELIYNYTVKNYHFVPSTNYKIFIFAYNGYQGEFIETQVTSPPDIPELKTELKIDATNNITANVIISAKKLRGKTDDYRFILFLSDEDDNFTNTQSRFNCTLNDKRPFNITIGDNTQPTQCEKTLNLPLKPGTRYNITVRLINTFAGKTRERRYSSVYKTTGKPPRMPSSNLLALLALLLFIPVAAICYLKKEKLIRILTPRTNTSTDLLEEQEAHIPLSTTVSQNNSIQAQEKVNKPPANPNKPKIHSKPVKIIEFEEYVKNSIQSGELERQHAIFPRGQTKPWTYAAIKENKSKNRYNNLLAYDHSRVILKKMENDPYSDYVNANYINGHKVPKAYIATQGPKASTLDDFWRMIWQENVGHIANVANIYEGGKKKVEKYWPDINETLHFGKVTVQHVFTKVHADFEHRIFNVSADGETRKLEQLHFSSWPDHGVPLYSQSLVPFLQKMLKIPISTKSPVVVHCSAGVGRTGTILLCDICLRMAAREGFIDVLRILHLLREQRANMVDNIEQYKLAHLVVLECLVGLHTSIQCNEIEEAVEKLFNDGSLTSQMRYLRDTQWQDQAMKTVGQRGAGAIPTVEEKNRFDNIIPEIQGRIFLCRCPPEDETSSYINAVKVDGFRSPGRFIVTQQPLPNTLGDFWRLIDETSVTVIVSLNKVNLKDKTSCQFWPTQNNIHMKPVPHITLKYVRTLPSGYYDVINIHLTSESRKEHLLVQIFSMKNWLAKTKCPKNIEQFLTFWEESDSVSRHSHPVVITCYDGVTASGLYVALSFIIEKMKLEQICDVCQAVRNSRHNRGQFVQDLEQFEFLYRAAVLYINGFKSYANFN